MESLLYIVIALTAIRIAIFALLHIQYPKFNPFKNTVSDYGTGDSRRLYSLIGSLSLLAYTGLFAYLLFSNYSPVWLIYILGIAVAGSIAILVFPTDLTGKKMTRTGRIHWLLAILNFSMLFVFMTNATIPDVASQPVALEIMTNIVRVAFYTFLASLVLPKLRAKYIGITERAFLTATPLWFITFSILLLIS